MATQLRLKLDGLKALQKGLHSIPASEPRITATAINYAINKLYTETWNIVQPQYFLKKKKYFANKTYKKRATTANLVGALIATGKNYTFSQFRFSPTQLRRRGRPAPARINVKVGPAVTVPVPEGVFIATMKSGHTGIYKRRTARHLPIYEPRSDVGPAAMLANEKVLAAADTIKNEAFNREFRRLTKVAMDKAFGGMPK